MQEKFASTDPYSLPLDAVKSPPKSLGAIVREIGPGIVLAGTIVGSGELILTTSLGAEFGFVFIWLILFSCFIKVFVQLELGRYTISAGKPTLGALAQIQIGRLNGKWLVWWWFFMLIGTVFQLGGMTGTIGQAMDLAFPSVADSTISLLDSLHSASARFVEGRREFPLAVIVCLITMALIYRGGYGRIELLTTVIVVSSTCLTMLACVALTWTEYAFKANDFAEGLKFSIPSNGITTAFAVFGITGVGASELFYYPYWCVEKGYARYVGVNDGSVEWHRRATGWIKVMYFDAWISMIVYTVSTVAFYFMGAAVLHSKGLNPSGSKLVEVLAQMYSGPFGACAGSVFLFAAAAVLFKTLYLACAANSRLTTDFLAQVGIAQIDNPKTRSNVIAILCLFYPCMALFLYCLTADPKLMVKIGGFAQAATLPMIALAAIYFRYFKTEPALRPSGLFDLFLWIAISAILIAALYAIPNQLAEIETLLFGQLTP